jgi:hypothetical protein
VAHPQELMGELDEITDLEEGEKITVRLIVNNLDIDRLLTAERREPVTYPNRFPSFSDLIFDYPFALQRGYLILTDRRLIFFGKIWRKSLSHPKPSHCDIITVGRWQDMIELRIIGKWLRLIFLKDRSLETFYFQDIFEPWEFWMDGSSRRKEVTPTRLMEMVSKQAEVSSDISSHISSRGL